MSQEVAASPTHLPEVGNTEAANNNEEEPLDPRVGPELERLNAAAESVNYLETELTQGKIAINKYMQDMVAQLKDAAETVGASRIEQAREYYDSLSQSEFLKLQLCEASAAYKLSVSKCEVAKEMLRIAEQGFLERANAAEGNAAHIDFTYQEMLNHATETVVRAENERADCDRLVRELTSRTAEMEIKLNLIRRQHPRSIERSARYFELRQRTDAELKDRRRRCEEIAALLRRAKASYRRSMRRLDKISNEIHQRRVGCAVPAPAASADDDEEEEEEEEIDQNVPRNSSNVAKINVNVNINDDVPAFASVPSRPKRPSILESAMQSARNMVESATRTRKSVSIMPTGASLSLSHNGTANSSANVNVEDRNARSLSQLSFASSVGDKTEEFPVDLGGRQGQAEPDTFRSEIERARWRRMGDSGSVPKAADSPIRGFRAQSISNSVTDTIDSQSESSSVASFLLDVAFEKLALNDVSDRPRTLATDSMSSVSRTSATTVESPLSNEPSQSLSEVECDTVTSRPSAIERVSFAARPVAESQEDRSRANSSDTETVAVEKAAQGPGTGTDSDAESDFEAIETAL